MLKGFIVAALVGVVVSLVRPQQFWFLAAPSIFVFWLAVLAAVVTKLKRRV